MVGVLKVIMKVLVFLLPPESSLTVMLVMAEKQPSSGCYQR